MVPTVQMLSAAENLESNFSVNSVKSEILEKTKKNVVELTWKCHSASVAIDWTFTVPSLYTTSLRVDMIKAIAVPISFFRAVSFQFQTICPSSHSKTGIPAAPLRSCMRPFWNSCRSSDVGDVAINKYFRHQITKLHDSFLAGNKCKVLYCILVPRKTWL